MCLLYAILTHFKHKEMMRSFLWIVDMNKQSNFSALFLHRLKMMKRRLLKLESHQSRVSTHSTLPWPRQNCNKMSILPWRSCGWSTSHQFYHDEWWRDILVAFFYAVFQNIHLLITVDLQNITTIKYSFISCSQTLMIKLHSVCI